MPIPKFKSLPAAILSDLRRVRDDLMAWPDLPRIATDVILHWDHLIEEWIAQPDMPLIVRKSSHERVCLDVLHPEGRRIAPSDNSPAHWVAIQCFDNRKLTISELRAMIPEIPMTMAVSKREAVEGNYPYPRSLSSFRHAGKVGWYLAHRKPVASGIPARIEDAPFGSICDHFRKLMCPSNFQLIPKQVAGLAELDLFFDDNTD